MTAIELLQERGPMPAAHIAAVLRLQRETVYAALVRAEDAGKARINVVHIGERRYCEWEAMDEVTA